MKKTRDYFRKFAYSFCHTLTRYVVSNKHVKNASVCRG